MRRLARQLSLGLVGCDGEAAESLDVILQLLQWTMQSDGPSLLIDRTIESVVESAESDCATSQFCNGTNNINNNSQERRSLLEHLWATLLNWTMRANPSSREHLFSTLAHLLHFSQRFLTDHQFTLLTCQPWNYLVLVDAVQQAGSVNALRLAQALIQLSQPTLKTYGIYLCFLFHRDISAWLHTSHNTRRNNISTGTHPWSVQLEECVSRHPLS